jgi:hypothetical protein
MDYFAKKYSPEKLKQRAFILSSFTRQKMTLTVSIYEFADYVIEKGWSPLLGNLEAVDKEILENYNFYINLKPTPFQLPTENA